MITEPPLAEIVSLLDDAGIEHMVVGSFASTFHGPPRSTQDLDLVVEIAVDTLDRLLESVDRDRFYVAETTARVAIEVDGGAFNLIDGETGWKIDLIVRRDRPFSRTEFGRRQRVVIGGANMFVASPEDTVLSKLEWSMMGGSDRQLADAVAVLAVTAGDIDEDYLDEWAGELGVTELLREARRRVGAGD